MKMGYFYTMGACINCGGIFSFNANLVPSSSALTGHREPICSNCIEHINSIRIEKGLEPIVPLPGAYEAEEE
jgi:hypothetical protein